MVSPSETLPIIHCYSQKPLSVCLHFLYLLVLLQCLLFSLWFSLNVSFCQTKGLPQTWSKGEAEEDDEGEKEEDTVDEEEEEEEEEDTSAEDPSSTLDDSTAKASEEAQSPVSVLFLVSVCVCSIGPVDTDM